MSELKGIKPTKEMSETLQAMRDYLNMALFNGELPECFITLTRNSNVIGGYHSKEQWENEDGVKVAEIGINSNIIADGNHIMLFEVLTHELIHLEQYAKGTQGRAGYHNQNFADRCAELGLEVHCHDKGREDKQTGQNVSTSMINNGLSAQVVSMCDLDLPYWTSEVIDIDGQGQPQKGEQPKTVPAPPKPKQKGASGSRTKFTCPTCGCSAWGKATLTLMCGDCYEGMISAV